MSLTNTTMTNMAKRLLVMSIHDGPGGLLIGTVPFEYSTNATKGTGCNRPLMGSCIRRCLEGLTLRSLLLDRVLGRILASTIDAEIRGIKAVNLNIFSLFNDSSRHIYNSELHVAYISPMLIYAYICSTHT